MRLREAYLGFRALPLWVQVWVVVLLAPVNVVSLWFLDEPGGYVVAVLALGGVIPNFVIGVWQGGLSKFLEFWHFVVWPPLVVVLLLTLSGDQLGGAGRIYHAALLTAVTISLAFDYRGARDWWRGDRAVADRTD